MTSQIPTILTLIFIAVAGQILIKLGLEQTGILQMSSVTAVLGSMKKIASSPLVVGGLALYAISSFVWLVVLSKVDLSFAFPFVSLTYVLVLVASILLFHEPLLFNRVAGSALIIVGVIVVGLR